MLDLTPEEQRVLGCLIEKQRTVPDTYPLTLNATVTACNQTSNRWPIVAYGEYDVTAALNSLREKGLTRVVHPSHGARTPKYRHVLDEVLRLADEEIAVLAVLLLRGPQTAGELRGRTERMHEFASLGEVEAVLARLAGRDEPLARLLDRQPGQKDPRWVHVLGEVAVPERPEGAGSGLGSGTGVAGVAAGRADRLADLEARVADLQRQVAHLYTVLGEQPPTAEEA